MRRRDPAEGFEAVFPYDPTSSDPRGGNSLRDYQAKYHEKPDQFAALAYDAMQILLQAICEAGLNRRHDSRRSVRYYEYNGVTGHMVFDPNSKNMRDMYLGTVHNGHIEYRKAVDAKGVCARGRRRRAVCWSTGRGCARRHD